MGEELTPYEVVRALFADTERLLRYYQVFAVPQCRLRFALRKDHVWAVPKGVKFPVALYDKRGVLMVAENESKLVAFLEKHQDTQKTPLFEVPKGSRFVWVRFEMGSRPELVGTKKKLRVHKIDWATLNQLERTNNLFFGDGVRSFRLQFAVTTDNHFRLMCGVVEGY